MPGLQLTVAQACRLWQVDVATCFNEIVDTLNRQGHEFSFKELPTEVFPGPTEIVATFRYFEADTCLGGDSSDRMALANKAAGSQPTKFSTWARVAFPVRAA
jgi:hypothetical protein